MSYTWRIPRYYEPYGNLQPWVESEACGICGHAEPHHPHPDGKGWPSTILKCASCPDGKCVLPETEGPQ
jgi:hypothetical protein